MSRDEFYKRQQSLCIQAGMNQRYHQHYAKFWWRLDTFAKVITAAMAVLGAMISVAAVYKDHSEAIDYLGVLVACGAAIAAVALNVIPFGTWEQGHRDLLRQWTDIREDAEALWLECAGMPEPSHHCELRKLDAKVHRVCGDEPSPNQKKLRQFYDAEVTSRKTPGAQQVVAPTPA